jgi:hypothetical protein
MSACESKVYEPFENNELAIGVGENGIL